MTLALVAANALVFWYELAVGRQVGPLLARWGLVPADLVAALRGDQGYTGALITPQTAMFLHADWLHLLRNLVYLWFFGRLLEAEHGPGRLLALYAAAGGTAAAVHVAATPGSTVPAVGASGAIAGLLGAYAGARPRRPGSTGGAHLLAVVLLALWLAALALDGILELARPIDGAGVVSWWGHLGGLVAGLILVSLYRQVRRELPGPAPQAGRRRPTHH